MCINRKHLISPTSNYHDVDADADDAVEEVGRKKQLQISNVVER